MVAQVNQKYWHASTPLASSVQTFTTEVAAISHNGQAGKALIDASMGEWMEGVGLSALSFCAVQAAVATWVVKQLTSYCLIYAGAEKFIV